MSEQKTPEMRKVRAIDVRPYEWGVWCTVGDRPEPIVNTIESRRWTDDGLGIWFGLSTHNFLSANPDDELELVPVPRPKYAPVEDDEAQAAFLAKRPKLTRVCEHCAGAGKVPA